MFKQFWVITMIQQRLAFNITPADEHELMEKNKGECTRFRLKHWLYV